MSANTAFLNLYKPGGGSSGLIVPDEVVDIDRINSNMDLIDSFASSWGLASRQTRDFTGPAASLASIVAAAGGARLGDTYQETDGNKRLWKYDGSNWVTNEGGLYLIRPTGVTGTGLSIAADGTVVGASLVAGACQIQGIFSAAFRNYRVLLDMSGKASIPGSMTLQGILASGSVVSSTNHFLQEISSLNGSTPPSAYQTPSSANFGPVMDCSGGVVSTDAVIFSPFDATRGTYISANMIGRGGALWQGTKTGSLDDNVSLSGLQINFGQNVTSARIKVYGMT